MHFHGVLMAAAPMFVPSAIPLVQALLRPDLLRHERGSVYPSDPLGRLVGKPESWQLESSTSCGSAVLPDILSHPPLRRQINNIHAKHAVFLDSPGYPRSRQGVSGRWTGNFARMRPNAATCFWEARSEKREASRSDGRRSNEECPGRSACTLQPWTQHAASLQNNYVQSPTANPHPRLSAFIRGSMFFTKEKFANQTH